MTDAADYLRKLFKNNNIAVNANRVDHFARFSEAEASKHAVTQIVEIQRKLMKDWNMVNRINDIKEQALSIPNATVHKPYSAVLDLNALNWKDITHLSLEHNDLGLEYDEATNTIHGLPAKSGDFKILLKFELQGQDESASPNYKKISLVINPDPRSLWKNIDSNRADPYWKEDNVDIAAVLGAKRLVAASKRGRSHATVGSFRDDDFAFKYFGESGWSLVAVADGAGSARLSRYGSLIACSEAVNYFSEAVDKAEFAELDTLIAEYNNNKNDAGVEQVLSKRSCEQLGAAAWHIHKKLEDAALANDAPLKDLHTTLIFTLFKKYDFGFAILTFGVGDCPIGLIGKGGSSATLMNWLDVGEYGGGTRFMTMPEVFASDKFYTRFGFKLVEDFEYLFMMTDGIYDPKFVVEANLERQECWDAFIADLRGNNPGGDKVGFEDGNADVSAQLASWMDFWSPGNHDDRTLVIIY